MKRRKALKNLGVGLSAGLWMPGLLTSCKKDDPLPEVQFDGTVVIIGAGAAGLYAADILNSKGVNVVVLEASNQLGGRVRSLRNQKELTVQTAADFPVELGAEVVYGTDSAFGDILKNYSLVKIELASVANNQFILESAAKPAADWTGDTDFNAVQNFVSGLSTYAGGDVSMKQAAGISTRGDALLNSQAGNYYGSSSENVGAKGVAEALGLIEHDNVSYLIKTNPLQDVLVSRFNQIVPKVRLNTIVKSINYSGTKIIITDQEGTQIEADKVIITTSLGVLKSGGVTFSPALPAAKTSAINKIGFDHSIRVVIDFKRNFWGEDAGFIWGGVEGPSYLNIGVNRSEFYRTLSVTVHGPKAQQLSAQGENMIDTILAELDAIYDGQATLYIRKVINGDGTEGPRVWFLADWGKDEFFKGGFSYLKPGSSVADRTTLAAPVNDKLFFAGEATDTKGDAGTINGALNSAERAVEELVTSIISA